MSVIVQPQYICLFSQDVSKNGQEVDTTKATQISDGQSGTSEEAEQKLLVSKKNPSQIFCISFCHCLANINQDTTVLFTNTFYGLPLHFLVKYPDFKGQFSAVVLASQVCSLS